jgi:hypothetical protein
VLISLIGILTGIASDPLGVDQLTGSTVELLEQLPSSLPARDAGVSIVIVSNILSLI